MRIWIDHSNSPHPLLFAPVARRLEEEGHEILVTARDNAQTLALARERWPHVEAIGDESPGHKLAKAAAIARRVSDLRRWASRTSPDVALSHNSYAQIAAASSLRIPAVTAMDFEYQPANHLAFRLARTVLIPEVIPLQQIRHQGAAPRKIVRYSGLKEALYVGDFEPDREILNEVGLSPRPETVVVLRTPPTRAVYHPSANPLFIDALRRLCDRPGLACVALTRHAEQIAVIDSLNLDNCIVPRTAIDSRSLMYAADVMIGAGGTMTREAALMGIPTWTMFAGRTPAVDRWLESEGMLRRLTQAAQLEHVGPRPADPRTPEELRQAGTAIERVVVGATLAAADGHPQRSDRAAVTA